MAIYRYGYSYRDDFLKVVDLPKGLPDSLFEVKADEKLPVTSKTEKPSFFKEIIKLVKKIK